MRWIEILEALKPIAKSSSPITILVAPRFFKDFQDFSKRFPPLADEFVNFLEAKLANPLTAAFKKDTQWHSISGSIPGLARWWHAHLHFGQAMVIYKATESTLCFATIVDHRSTEGFGHRIRKLAQYLDTIEVDPNAPKHIKVNQPVKPESMTPTELLSRLDINSSQVHSGSEKDQNAIKARIKDLFWEMVGVPADKKVMTDFLRGINKELLVFFDFPSPPIPTNAVSDGDIKDIIKDVLKGSQPSR